MSAEAPASPTRRVTFGDPVPQSRPPLVGGARLRWARTREVHPSGVIRIVKLTPSHRFGDLEAFFERLKPVLAAELAAEVAKGPVKVKVTVGVEDIKG